MDDVDQQRFVGDWLDAWNTHDVERVLTHFTDDVVFTSPVGAQLIEGSDGVFRGKAALRAYWTGALRRIPDLHFDLIAVYAGIDTLVINYRNHRGGLVNEVLVFEGTRVREGHGTYAVA